MKYEGFGGVSKSISEWVEDRRCKVSYDALHHRVLQGWDLEEAMETPPWSKRIK
jgi:hypothetical protein